MATLISFSVCQQKLKQHHAYGDPKFIFMQVYNVTPYVEEHPGGDAILAHAGDDSTEGFYGQASVNWIHLIIAGYPQ